MVSPYRPIDAGLRHARLPVGAVVSILHRVSGVAQVAIVGVALWMLRDAVGSPAGYAQTARWIDSRWGAILGPVACGVVAHHLYAGIRHLLFDAGIGRGRVAGRRSATLVLALVLATMAGAGLLWP
jgi:succinate dehydrogenase / fumarate reductase cytochrome b subunit